MITVAVVTVSDSAASGTREDISGPAVVNHCEALGWNVRHAETVPDEAEVIAARLRHLIQEDVARIILTIGGTGVAARDVTPEATRRIIEREIPGLAELMRSEGLKKTRFAALSRGVAGTAHHNLIVNLPGSPAGAVESLESIQRLIPHIVDLLAGRTEHDRSGTGEGEVERGKLPDGDEHL